MDPLDRERLQELMICQEMNMHVSSAQMMVAKRDGHVLFANPSARRLWSMPYTKGTRVEDILSRHTWSNGRRAQDIAVRLKNLKTRDDPFEVDAESSEIDHLAHHCITFTPSHHPVTGEETVVISAVETTDLRKAQSKLVEELKSQELTFNSISHELRAPLSGIIGLTDAALMASDDLPGHLRKSLKVIKATGQRMSGLVNDLLDAVSTRHSKLVIKHEPCNLREITQEVIDIMTPLVRRNVTIHNLVPEHLPTFEGDSRRVSQILTNLLSNSCKFTSKGSVTVSAEQHGDKMQIFVVDTGLGIPSDKLESIFGAFQQVDEDTTRKYGGTGLGLALVKSLVTAHHGSVDVSSVFGTAQSGTTFTLNLPLSQPAEPVHADLTPPSSSNSTLPSLSRGCSSGLSAVLKPDANQPEPADTAAQLAAANAQCEDLRAQAQRLAAELREREEELSACQRRLAGAEEALLTHGDDKPVTRSASVSTAQSNKSRGLSRSSSGRSGDGLSALEELERSWGIPPASLGGSALSSPVMLPIPRAHALTGSPRGRHHQAQRTKTDHQLAARPVDLHARVGVPQGQGAACSGFPDREEPSSSACSPPRNASVLSASPPLQGVLLQHMLEREELRDRRRLNGRELGNRHQMADAILASIQHGAFASCARGPVSS